MKKIITVFLLLLGYTTYAQLDTSIIGVWRVEEVFVPKDSIPQDRADEIKEFLDAFKTCSFHFEKNGSFILDISYEDMKIPDAIWSYDSINKIIKVTEKEDSKSVLMIITVDKNTNGETYFILQETPMRLKMKNKNGL